MYSADSSSSPGEEQLEPSLSFDGVTFERRDATLLRTIDECGSLNKAASALGRSYSHTQRRIVALEEAIGPLVERQRGGGNRAGSRLTASASQLLSRFDRLQSKATTLVEEDEPVLFHHQWTDRGTVERQQALLAFSGLIETLEPTEVVQLFAPEQEGTYDERYVERYQAMANMLALFFVNFYDRDVQFPELYIDLLVRDGLRCALEHRAMQLQNYESVKYDTESIDI